MKEQDQNKDFRLRKSLNLNSISSSSSFSNLHIGPNRWQKEKMLKALSLKSLNELMEKVLPDSIRNKTIEPEESQILKTPLSEKEFLERALSVAKKNKIFKSYIGMGFLEYQMPYVIQRNVLENPKWYTSYTPYQSEISQGRLQALLNFQTLITDLTQMEISNASLLDESTAAAEAMIMAYNIQIRKKKSSLFFISEDSFPQTIEVLRTRAQPLNIEIEIGNPEKVDFSKKNYFACFLQYPSASGKLYSFSFYENFSTQAHKEKMLLIVSANLFSLSLISAPGEWGADIVIGNANLGLPLSFGGPHAAYISTLDIYKRYMPGRIVGVSKDQEGNEALRLSLQTREQHIRRERATSNICTAQALPAILTSFYVVFKGQKGLIKAAKRVHFLTHTLYTFLKGRGIKPLHSSFFDTLLIPIQKENDLENSAQSKKRDFLKTLIEKNILVYSVDEKHIQISIDESTTDENFKRLLEVFNNFFSKKEEINKSKNEIETLKLEEKTRNFNFSKDLIRKTPFLTHPVFNSHHSETQLLRYITHLESKDLSLAHSMIPLGSCTMKLNSTSEMIPVTWKEFSNIHPFSPMEFCGGFEEMIGDLSAWLCHLTGFSKISFQPNAGSQGEYAGLLTIKNYYASIGETKRNLCLIPSSAHGTNPASAAMAGFDVLIVQCDSNGNVDVEDLRKKANKHSSRLGVFMITYPSTHGVFEEEILEICHIIHSHKAQVYLDGANFNALVGLVKLSSLGADLAHLNLHKTFCIPHGGGGPGVGPLCVSKHLEDFLPSHNMISNLNSYLFQTVSKTHITDKIHTDKNESSEEEEESMNQKKGLKQLNSFNHFEMQNTKEKSRKPFVISSAPYGNANVFPVTWGYLSMMGMRGLREASLIAILNANYIAQRLNPYFPILYKGKNGLVAHECVLDLRPLKETAHVTVEDVAKRLMDYGFHAPTMSWPVTGTLMIEPTESESLEELDRFCESMISIRKEIQEIEEGKMDKKNNVLKNAPHSISYICKSEWNHPYSRENAAFPKPWLRKNKFWPSVSRIDNVYGDKNLVCLCSNLADLKE